MARVRTRRPRGRHEIGGHMRPRARVPAEACDDDIPRPPLAAADGDEPDVGGGRPREDEGRQSRSEEAKAHDKIRPEPRSESRWRPRYASTVQPALPKG